MTYTCPVCGFGQMPFAPADHNICSCCGTEFGYHDLRLSHRALLKRWIENGALWFSIRMPAPSGWNPYTQLLNAGLIDVTFGDPENLTVDMRVVGRRSPVAASNDVGTAAA